jgi:hypothetical protein
VRVLQSEGSNSVIINTNGLISGIYFCKVTSDNSVLRVKKIVLVK